jgi:hypothetical protein
MMETMKKDSFPGDHHGLSSHTLIENQMADMSRQFIQKNKTSNEKESAGNLINRLKKGGACIPLLLRETSN